MEETDAPGAEEARKDCQHVGEPFKVDTPSGQSLQLMLELDEVELKEGRPAVHELCRSYDESNPKHPEERGQRTEAGEGGGGIQVL